MQTAECLKDLMKDDGPMFVRRLYLLEVSMWQKTLPALETILGAVSCNYNHHVERRPGVRGERGEPRTVASRTANVCAQGCAFTPELACAEGSVKIRDMIAEEAYYDWLLSGRPKEQKLLLTQLAEEKIVNPNQQGGGRRTNQ
jgi:hypothetical protein